MDIAASTRAGATSISDVLTAIKNIVLALNNETQTYLNINGSSCAANIGTATVVKTSPGRIVTISVITPGSTTGLIYDGAAVTATTKPLAVIQSMVGIFPVNLVASDGIVVIPGTGQVVSVGYS